MEDQLANSSCLVGSWDRFLNIAENQNQNSVHAQQISPTPERRATLKRRTVSAKLRLSQINTENVSLIEQRVHHRESSVIKIQNTCRQFLLRQLTRRQAVKRSENIVHYHVLTHLLSLQHSKKRSSVLRLQRWWRRCRIRRRAATTFLFTQRGRWSLRQASLVKGN